MEKKACIVDIKKNRNKYLRQPSIDFDFCNITYRHPVTLFTRDAD